jgi:hypothetical protein
MQYFKFLITAGILLSVFLFFHRLEIVLPGYTQQFITFHLHSHTFRHSRVVERRRKHEKKLKKRLWNVWIYFLFDSPFMGG